VVLNLFEGEFGDEVIRFETPIVLFGGDIASCSSVSELFYRDFISTWEQVIEDRYKLCMKELAPAECDFRKIQDQFYEWKKNNQWADDSRKLLEELRRRRE